MERRQQDLPCESCGHIGREELDDGYFYCQGCGAQLDIVTGDDFFLMDGGNAPHFTRNSQASAAVVLTPEPLTTYQRFTQEDDAINASNIRVKTEKDDYSQYLDGIGPTEPVDFPSGGSPKKLPYEKYYEEVRINYVLGMQWMIQLQCEALVDKFNVRPLICGLASTFWLRFLAGTGVFRDGWADSVVHQSESQGQGDLDEHRKFNALHRNEPRNAYGQRAVMLWFKRLRETIPLSCSLAISFLACHVAREAILPTDILKWSIEGKLPYFAAHVEIEKRLGRMTFFCEISPSLMFRPSQTVPVQRLEKMAATIAESIGLHLPPVNFYEIASRYLKKLSVSVERVLPHACRIYEWSMPPDLWLSANELRLPTRVCVMSILIVAIRIMYNINGFGVWERSLSNRSCSPSSSQHTNKLGSASSSETKGGAEKVEGSPLHKMVDDSSRDNLEIPSHGQTSHFDSTDLLNHLEATYNQIGVSCEFTKDLPSYLEYCKDVVFAGAGSSHVDHNEEDLIEKLWDFYQNEKDSEMEVEAAGTQNSSAFKEKRSRNDDKFFQTPVRKKEKREQWLESPSANISVDSAVDSMEENSEENHCISDNSHGDENLEQKNEEDSEEKWKKKRIRQLKIDMQEDRFFYIPPRVKVKRLDYLHYVRKKDAGALRYAVHADYYILLRACARVAEIDIRNMHNAVLSFERRLSWLEKRIDVCSHLMLPSVSCEFCCRERNKFDDDPMTT